MPAQNELCTATDDSQKLSDGACGDGAEQAVLTLEQVLSPDFQPPRNYHWYFLRISYCRAEQLYEELKDGHEGCLVWMPCQKHVTYQQGVKYESLAPLFKGNLFVYGTYEQAHAITHRSGLGYPWVDFVFDHTLQNLYGRDKVLVIPFDQMQSFARAAHVQHPWAHIVPEEKIHFRPGGPVRVTGGSFEGVVGRVARVYGQTRVVVTIRGIGHYCTAYVSPRNLEPIEEYSKKRIKQSNTTK